MILLKLEKSQSLILEKTRSQSLSKDKNFLKSSHSTNLAKPTLKISWQQKSFLLDKI